MPAWRSTRDSARERGIDHVCMTEHCHRFRQAAGLLDHPFWTRERAGRPGRLRRPWCAAYGEPVACGIELDWLEGPRGGDRAPWSPTATSTSCSARCTGSAATPSITRTTRSGRSMRRPTRSGAGTSRRCARQRPRASSTCWRTSIWPRCSGTPPSRSVIASEHEETADAIAAAGVAVEISTAGLRKAAGELYPAQGFCARCTGAACRSRSARTRTSRTISAATTTARSARPTRCGYRTVSMFSGRERREVPLG